MKASPASAGRNSRFRRSPAGVGGLAEAIDVVD